VREERGQIAPGDWKLLDVKTVGPLSVSWKLVHRESDSELGFSDVQESGPFRSWRHNHRFLPQPDSTSVLEDELSYELPFGAAGRSLLEGRLGNELDRLFFFRHRRTQQDLERHARAKMPVPLRIAVAGSSGLVGTRLVPFLRAGGHEVFRLVRHATRRGDEIFWNPATEEIDAAALECIDAVVNLAGVSLFAPRWTASRKEAIRKSRIDGTRLLARTLASLNDKPAVFVSTSAVGFYGDGGEAVLTEQSSHGQGFLSDTCSAWEAAAAPAADAGIRVVHPRVGVVMAGEGGMLPLVARVFQLGAGGKLGDGRQFMSWIALDDLLGILLESIANEHVRGPVNAVSPNPVTNAEFTAALADVLHRPSFMPAPAFALRLAGGQMMEELALVSQRVVPACLEQQGFPFAFPAIEHALRHELGRFEHALMPVGNSAAFNVHPLPS
jgi:uncharacterized protein (TIGR01777 family)